MHDAAILANYIDALPDHPVTEEIERAFKSYRDDRFPWVELAFEQSRMFRNMVDKVPPLILFNNSLCDSVIYVIKTQFTKILLFIRNLVINRGSRLHLSDSSSSTYQHGL
jgi:hypothetical protein